MESIVFEKVVLVNDADGSFCYCDEEFSRLCAIRLAGNLPCRKSMVRITVLPTSRKEKSPSIVKLSQNFFDTIDKMGEY
jgi:hypothetical protein